MGTGAARAAPSSSTRVFRAATWCVPLLVLGAGLAAGFALDWLALPVVDPLAPDVRHGVPYAAALLAGFDPPRIRTTTVTARALVRRTGLRTRTVPWHDVAYVAFVTRSDRSGGQRVDVALQLASGRVLHVLPDDGDVLALYDAARTAHAAFVRERAS